MCQQVVLFSYRGGTLMGKYHICKKKNKSFLQIVHLHNNNNSYYFCCCCYYYFAKKVH